MSAIPIEYLSCHPTGSRYIVEPPVLDTDDDMLVLVKDLDAATRELVENAEWAPDLDEKYDVLDGCGWRFRSFRGPNKLNLIVTDDATMYLRSVGATLVAKALNLQNKEDRLHLFWEIKFGGWVGADSHFFVTEHYSGPLP